MTAFCRASFLNEQAPRQFAFSIFPPFSLISLSGNRVASRNSFQQLVPGMIRLKFSLAIGRSREAWQESGGFHGSLRWYSPGVRKLPRAVVS
jgi:hypothetical protein